MSDLPNVERQRIVLQVVRVFATAVLYLLLNAVE